MAILQELLGQVEPDEGMTSSCADTGSVQGCCAGVIEKRAMQIGYGQVALGCAPLVLMIKTFSALTVAQRERPLLLMLCTRPLAASPAW